MIITSLILGATVGIPVGAIAVSISHGDKVREWRRRFYEAVADLADTAIERDQLKQQVAAMKPMHDLGVRRHATMQAEMKARKVARRAKREGAGA